MQPRPALLVGVGDKPESMQSHKNKTALTGISTMKIRLNETNREEITSALVSANGRATEHTFNGATQILEAAAAAEAQLERLFLSKAQRVGATATSTSGRAISRSYKYPRTTTCIAIERGNRDWYLRDVTTDKTYDYSAGETFVTLNDYQDEIAVIAFRATYGAKPMKLVRLES
jgi:hypothetical protein